MANLLFYEQINLLLLLGSGGLILLVCLLPLPGKRYLKADGIVHELPPLAPVLPAKYPELIDKLLTLFYLIISTLLFATPFLIPNGTAEVTGQIPGIVDAWFNTFTPFLIYLPLMIRYGYISVPLAKLSLKKLMAVIMALFTIYALNFCINLTGFYEWVINVTGSPETQQAIQSMKNAHGALFIPMAVSAIIVAPIVEEIFFRGFIFRLLSCRIDVVSAALLSGLYFGAVHLSLVQTVTLTIFGVVQCFLYVKTRSIMYPIILHAVFNAIAVAVLCLTI